MKFHKAHIIPAIILLFSFLLRLSLISKGPYHIDCLVLTIKALKTLDTLQVQHLYGPGYPLTVILGALFIAAGKLFSVVDPVISINMMSVVFSSLCVYLMYYFVKELFDERTAFFSAFLWSVMPAFLGVSVYGKSHAPSLFFLLAGMLSLVHFHKKGGRRFYLFSVLSFGLMGAARAQDLVLMFPAVSFLFAVPLAGRQMDTKDMLKNFSMNRLFAFWALVAFVAFTFHMPFILGKSGGYASQLSSFWQRGISTNFKPLYFDALRVSLFFAVNSLSIPGFFFALLGGVHLLRQRRPVAVFLLLWVLVPWAFYGNLTSVAPRFFIMSLAGLIILESCFIRYLLNYNRRFTNALVLGSVVIIFCINIINIVPILSIRHTHALLPDFARQVALWTEENARIIVGDDANFISYYGHRKIIKRPRKVYFYLSKDLLKFKDKIDGILREGIPVYITDSGLHSYDYRKQFSDFMKKHYELQYLGKHLSESWHFGETTLHIGWELLYKISPAGP